MYPKVTFGMIVLNAEPFIRYNLEALYPFAHQIIVVEGACHSAAAISNDKGHSRDSTLATLVEFKRTQDPQNKVTIICAEDEGYPDGFWPGEKHEMCRAYASRATGNWLWQVDADEFYTPHDMREILCYLTAHPEKSQLSFSVKTFSGSPKYLVDSVYLRAGAQAFRRVFSWRTSYRYVTHRPPTVIDESGRDCPTLRPMSAHETAAHGWLLYHYEQLFPKQVLEKCAYYSAVEWSSSFRRMHEWATGCYMELNQPYRVHMVYSYPSWFEECTLPTPPAIAQMMADVEAGQFPEIQLRRTDDIAKLLESRAYSGGVRLMKMWSGIYVLFMTVRHCISLIRRRLWQ